MKTCACKWVDDECCSQCLEAHQSVLRAREAKRKRVTEEAQEAFWAVVAKAYPEAEHGDFPPDATMDFDTACEDAVESWTYWNAPLNANCERCEPDCKCKERPSCHVGDCECPHLCEECHVAHRYEDDCAIGQCQKCSEPIFDRSLKPNAHGCVDGEGNTCKKTLCPKCGWCTICDEVKP